MKAMFCQLIGNLSVNSVGVEDGRKQHIFSTDLQFTRPFTGGWEEEMIQQTVLSID